MRRWRVGCARRPATEAMPIVTATIAGHVSALHSTGQPEALIEPARQRVDFANRLLGRLPGGLQDKRSDGFGMGNHRQVARFELDRLGAHALGHQALEVWIYGSIFG